MIMCNHNVISYAGMSDSLIAYTNTIFPAFMVIPCTAQRLATLERTVRGKKIAHPSGKF